MMDMTQSQVAEAADLGLSTVVDFEKQRRQISPEAIAAIQQALERAGIQFIEQNGGGPGVRLRKKSRRPPT
jgi:transcriptional regulator with XRE-family HTH domain